VYEYARTAALPAAATLDLLCGFRGDAGWVKQERWRLTRTRTLTRLSFLGDWQRSRV